MVFLLPFISVAYTDISWAYFFMNATANTINLWSHVRFETLLLAAI